MSEMQNLTVIQKDQVKDEAKVDPVNVYMNQIGYLQEDESIVAENIHIAGFYEYLKYTEKCSNDASNGLL